MPHNHNRITYTCPRTEGVALHITIITATTTILPSDRSHRNLPPLPIPASPSSFPCSESHGWIQSAVPCLVFGVQQKPKEPKDPAYQTSEGPGAGGLAPNLLNAPSSSLGSSSPSHTHLPKTRQRKVKVGRPSLLPPFYRAFRRTSLGRIGADCWTALTPPCNCKRASSSHLVFWFLYGFSSRLDDCVACVRANIG
ncbi:uncharacterized protein LY79DRAFT_388361 [Colletotrichum navitas]|uniref:Uncharacterized protein n=1 Tax=Colletotrichum navitas TaxID=681940 RepID=A0AAD8Q836_9PEZI|nr:uncharacterized protein LY79DRAFT_388361 [Colletotrichum navitas]KAK1597505.1 hypothetical protein LY79DRAFT_388361 [Colletotrichum navitas]